MREEKGYSYGARASANPGRRFGTVVAASAVEGESTAEGLTDMLSVLREAESFTDEERVRALSANRTAMISAMGGRSRISGALVRVSRQGLPLDALTTQLAAEAAVTTEELVAAWAPKRGLSEALILVVGDLAQIRESVEAAVPGTWEVVDQIFPTLPQ
jgi:zinc protease